MGTRADFYVGRGKGAEWLGSVAFDGYPDGTPEPLLSLRTEEEYRKAVGKILEEEDSATKPEQGWPWPWEDSNTTDYAYAFDAGDVWHSNFGDPWECWDTGAKGAKPEFPDMSARRDAAPPGSARSGIVLLVAKREDGE